MRCIAIIATRDFKSYWQIANENFIELNNKSSDKKLLIWRMDDELIFHSYKDKIINQLNNATDTELGVIFHKFPDGDVIAASLRDSLTISLNDNLAFCEWYSSNKPDFWNEGNQDDNKPYNNLKKAWKDGIGNKEETFEVVWDYFLGKPYLKSLIHLYKSLSLIPLKYKEIEQGSLNQEIENIQKKKGVKVKLAFAKYDPKDFEANNWKDKLIAIEKEIIQLSSQ